MIFHMNQNPYEAEQNDIILSNTVFEVNVAVLTGVAKFDENGENTVAVSRNNLLGKWYISFNYPSWKIKEYDSSAEADKAVQSGEADCFVAKAGQSLKTLEDSKMRSIFLTKSGASCFAVTRENTTLMNILNKTIQTLPDSRLSSQFCVYENAPGKVTLAEYIKDNLWVVSIWFVSVVLIIVWIIVYLLIQARKAKIQAEKANAAKSEFLFNMSHDIRTPMNAIIGFTTLAVSNIDDKERVRDYLGKILSSSNHLLSLINDILDMSRIESGKIHLEETEVSLSEVLHDLKTIISGQIHAKQLELYMDVMDVTDEDVYCDKTRLNQILLNLLSNAIKFTPAGGTVSVRVRQLAGKVRGCGQYEFRIKDNGIGINKEFQKHIFEEFTREESSTVSGIQGTGLGLSITKNIVDLMGGTITLESEPGKGSEFIVDLCFARCEQKVEQRQLPQLEGLRALVADDDTDTCLSVSTMLSKIGMRPEWTISGKEAVIRTKYAVEQGDAFSVYIIDWLIPDMNGIEIVRQIRKVIGDSCPIIILTAYDWADIEEEARAAGVTAFCEKPLFLSELRKVLAEPFRVQPVQTTAPQPKADFDGKHLLLVEDNELNREIAVEIIGSTGITIDTAINGLDAVHKVAQSEEGFYQIILMDIQMPIMDGYEATRQIRSLQRRDIAHMPIIAMTANAFSEDVTNAIKAGMNYHLAKPIDIGALMGILSKYLQAPA